MKIEKAIEILDDMVNPENTIGNEQDKAAINLGIEALKRVKQCRFPPYGRMEETLPGETKE